MLKKIRRILSLASARLLSSILKVWRPDDLAYSPEEWRQMKISFAENGEDLIVLDLLKSIPRQDRGVYVDAGAFNPVLISNTHLLYKHGWRGVNIDASPLNIMLFDTHRRGDKNICVALSIVEAEFLFLEYQGGTGSRLVPLDKDGEKSLCGDKVIRSSKVTARPLTDILHSVLGNNSKIDFLSVDCEGLDWEIVSGFDFSRFRPKLICVETAWVPNGVNRFPEFFEKLNYRLHAHTPSNSIFICNMAF